LILELIFHKSGKTGILDRKTADLSKARSDGVGKHSPSSSRAEGEDEDSGSKEKNETGDLKKEAREKIQRYLSL